MAIKVYTGRMGSGKSYEVVTVVILGAIKQGRRVVSNIAGLQYNEMCRVLAVEGADVSSLGQIVTVTHEQVVEKGFFRSDSNPDAFIQPGDLLVLDECWRFYDGFSNVPDEVMNFFRMHRHFVHSELGHTCEVALITQDINDLGRKIRPVVEETYYMEKLTVIGSNKRYRVDIFSGARKYRDIPYRRIQRMYNPAYFCLYQSHSQKKEGDADAKEVNIDNRGNILKSKYYRFFIPACFLLSICSVWYVYHFFTKDRSNKDVPVPSVPVPSVPVPSVPVPSVPVSQSVSVPSSVRRSRVSGYFLRGDARVVYLIYVNNSKRFLIEFYGYDGSVIAMMDENMLFIDGWKMFVSVDDRSAVLTNGDEVHSVSIDVRRLSRLSSAGGGVGVLR